jgi:hypothetical protein
MHKPTTTAWTGRILVPVAPLAARGEALLGGAGR